MNIDINLAKTQKEIEAAEIFNNATDEQKASILCGFALIDNDIHDLLKKICFENLCGEFGIG